MPTRRQFIDGTLSKDTGIILRKELPELLYINNRRIQLKKGTLPVGVTDTFYHTIKEFGRDGENPEGINVQTVEVEIDRKYIPVYYVWRDVRFSWMQLKRFKLANSSGRGKAVNFIKETRNAAGGQLLKELNQNTMFGLRGQQGFFKQLPEEILTFDIYANAATEQQIMEVFTTQIADLLTSNRINANSKMAPSILTVPGHAMNLFKDKHIQDTSLNIEETIKKRYPNIKEIEYDAQLQSNELEANGYDTAGTGLDLAVLTPKTEEFAHVQLSKLIKQETYFLGSHYHNVMGYGCTVPAVTKEFHGKAIRFATRTP